ncbi:MAG TPA: hypothetical protein VE870_06220, partial [Bacteroidales bacterium]|nr:hypothetical protein [Bacteroidales bacterium]
MKHFITKNRLISLSGIIFLLVLWKAASFISGSEQIVPSPERTFVATAKVFMEAGFWSSLGSTILRG